MDQTLIGTTPDNEPEYLEVPSCIESLVSSAEQIRQLANKIVNCYQKQLICYGLSSEQLKASRINDQSRFMDSSSDHDNVIMGTRNDNQQHVVSFSSISSRSSPMRSELGKTLAFSNEEMGKILGDECGLKVLDNVQRVLPLLDEISSTVELCVATVESTFKRAAYHLTKLKLDSKKVYNHNLDNPSDASPFRLSANLKLDSIMFAFTDLIYALVFLEQLLKDHTTLNDDLKQYITTCRSLADSMKSAKSDSESLSNGNGVHQTLTGLKEFEQVPLDKLCELIDYVSSIRITLALSDNEGSLCGELFFNMLNQLRHLDLILSKDKTRSGFDELQGIFTDFFQFYCEQMLFNADLERQNQRVEIKSGKSWRKMLAIYLEGHAHFMDSTGKRLLGIVGLFAVFVTVFKRAVHTNGKHLSKLMTQMMRKLRPDDNVIVFESSICVLKLSSFVRQTLGRVSGLQCEIRLLDQLEKHHQYLDAAVGQQMLASKLENLRQQVDCLLIDLNRVESTKVSALGYASLLERAISLARKVRNTSRLALAAHQQKRNGKPITRANLITVFRLVAQLKVILSQQIFAQLAELTARLDEHQTRLRWRRSISSFMRRQLRLKYSERKLGTSTLLTLSSACLKPELLSSSQGRSLASIYLSILADSLSSEEINELGALLPLAPDCHLLLARLEQATDCQFLYWSQPTFGLYYTWAFEESSSTAQDLQYFLLAADDMFKLLQVAGGSPDTSGHTAVDQAEQNKLESAPMGPQTIAPFAWLDSQRSRLIKRLEVEVCSQFRSDYLDRVCQEFEVELRLQTHRELCADEHSNPFKRLPYNFKQILHAAPGGRFFKLCGRLIDLRQHVEQYLNRICYNLAALSPQDWNVYESMLNLAERKFGLHFVPNQLPAQNLDSSLDLFELTRNLSLFASHYSYDLANELFIEKCSLPSSARSMISSQSQSASGSLLAPHNTWLNVIQLEHLSRWLYAHGFGLLDSAINCSYQTIKRLVSVFSRQLADEHLCATLQKLQAELSVNSNESAAGFAQQQHHQSNKSLTYERVSKLSKRCKLIRASSLAFNESRTSTKIATDLDGVRQTVTQIGNLIAFVRLIKSAALNCASKAADYLPDLADLAHNTDRASNQLSGYQSRDQSLDESQLHDCLLMARKNFDICLRDLEANFSPKSNYLEIIVKLFTELLAEPDSSRADCKHASSSSNRSEQSHHEVHELEPEQKCYEKSESNLKMSKSANREHLKLFYLIVPVLVLDYIDLMIVSKDRLTARSAAGRFGALISDDGFALGLAFLLTTLKQTGRFQSLRWLDTLDLKLNQDIEQVEQRLQDSKLEEALSQTSNMALRRLSRLHDEYQTFKNTLNCSLLLMRTC